MKFSEDGEYDRYCWIRNIDNFIALDSGTRY